MADTDTDAIRKQKKAEYDKQYRLKRKLVMQWQASTPTEPELAEKQKKAEYVKQYRMKRKLLMQQQASTSSETELVQKQKSKRIPSIFKDESTGSCICLRSLIYMSHVSKVQPIRVKMVHIAAICVTCI
jgi:phosphoglycerate-specific signal transduction histidine kinase